LVVGLLRACLERARQKDPEFAALSQSLAMRLDVPPVQLRQSARQGEADSEPSLGAGAGGLQLREHLEELRERLWGQPNPGIPNCDHSVSAANLRAQGYLAAGVGVLACVGEQVGDDLCEPQGIRIQDDRLGSLAKRQPMLLALQQRTRG